MPVEPRLLADDATPEALASLMADHGGPDGRPLRRGRHIRPDRRAVQQRPKANLDLYLKAWSGSPHRVDRKGRPAEHIERPALTVGLTVQPDVLRSIAGLPGFRGRGLIGRHLFSLPSSLLGRRDRARPQVADEDTEAFRQTMAALVRTVTNRAKPTELIPDPRPS